MDIEDECTEIDLASDSVRSPVSSLGKAFQQLQLGQNTPPLRNNKRPSVFCKGTGAVTRRRKQKPRSRISRENLERRLHTKNKALGFVPRLIRHDLITFFSIHFERAIDSWVSILIRTTIPDNVASSDPYVTNAFKLLDNARTDRDFILSRLAYVLLAHVFESLKGIIASDRRNGQLPARESGYRNASVAIDIYLSAQEQAGTSRDKVKKRHRVARRWRTLAGPSPIFVIIYSEAAEGLAYVRLFDVYAALSNNLQATDRR